jgi:hypothetical protein
MMGQTDNGWLRDQIRLISEWSGKTRGQIADLAKTYGEFDESVRGAVISVLNVEITQRDAETAKIKERAALEGKSVESAEIQRRIMEAQVNAYYSLLEDGRAYIETLDKEKEAALDALNAGMERAGGRGLRRERAPSQAPARHRRRD